MAVTLFNVSPSKSVCNLISQLETNEIKVRRYLSYQVVSFSFLAAATTQSTSVPHMAMAALPTQLLLTRQSQDTPSPFPLLTKCFLPLSFRRSVASFAISYLCFNANRPLQLSNCVPPPALHACCARTLAHPYSAHLPHKRVNSYIQYFILFTSNYRIAFVPPNLLLPEPRANLDS